MHNSTGNGKWNETQHAKNHEILPKERKKLEKTNKKPRKNRNPR